MFWGLLVGILLIPDLFLCLMISFLTQIYPPATQLLLSSYWYKHSSDILSWLSFGSWFTLFPLQSLLWEHFILNPCIMTRLLTFTSVFIPHRKGRNWIVHSNLSSYRARTLGHPYTHSSFSPPLSPLFPLTFGSEEGFPFLLWSEWNVFLYHILISFPILLTPIFLLWKKMS